MKTRQCNKPTPSSGGAECEGERKVVESCNDDVPCPGTLTYTYFFDLSTSKEPQNIKIYGVPSQKFRPVFGRYFFQKKGGR